MNGGRFWTGGDFERGAILDGGRFWTGGDFGRGAILDGGRFWTGGDFGRGAILDRGRFCTGDDFRLILNRPKILKSSKKSSKKIKIVQKIAKKSWDGDPETTARWRFGCRASWRKI